MDPQAVLSPPSGGSNEYFGLALALDQDRLAVGAPLAKPSGVGSGALYIFARTAGTWSPSLSLAPSDGVEGDYFGRAVGLVGDRVAAGAPFHDLPSGLNGAVYVYDLVSPNGGVCSAASDCESGFCVDGVCCDTACGDAVAGSTGAGVGGSAGGLAGNGGAGAASASSGSDSGRGCRLAPDPRPRSSAGLVLLGVALLIGRRRISGATRPRPDWRSRA